MAVLRPRLVEAPAPGRGRGEAHRGNRLIVAARAYWKGRQDGWALREARYALEQPERDDAAREVERNAALASTILAASCQTHSAAECRICGADLRGRRGHQGDGRCTTARASPPAAGLCRGGDGNADCRSDTVLTVGGAVFLLGLGWSIMRLRDWFETRVTAAVEERRNRLH